MGGSVGPGFRVGAAVGFGVAGFAGDAVGTAVRGASVPTGVVAVAEGMIGDAIAAAVGEGATVGVDVAAGVAGGGEPLGGRGEAVAGPALGLRLGLALGTTAMTPLGRADAAARSWISTPPMPSATVARTRFTAPRAKMSRAR